MVAKCGVFWKKFMPHLAPLLQNAVVPGAGDRKGYAGILDVDEQPTVMETGTASFGTDIITAVDA